MLLILLITEFPQDLPITLSSQPQTNYNLKHNVYYYCAGCRGSCKSLVLALPSSSVSRAGSAVACLLDRLHAQAPSHLASIAWVFHYIYKMWTFTCGTHATPLGKMRPHTGVIAPQGGMLRFIGPPLFYTFYDCFKICIKGISAARGQ